MTTTVGTVTTVVKKIEESFSYDWDNLPIESRRFLADYGTKQWLADAHAPCVEKNYGTRDLYMTDVRARVMVRDTAIRTGVGLPGAPKPNVAKELAAAMARIAELEAQVNRAVKRVA